MKESIRKFFFIPLCCLITILAVSSPAFAITQNYPSDYTQCYMLYHYYQPDWFANASNTPTSQGYRDAQTYYGKRIFQVAFNTTADPLYMNMWGTYSSSQEGAHEGLDMIRYDGAPVKHWGSDGVVTVKNASTGLIGIYCSSINETIFYRHMTNVTLNVGSSVPHNTVIGNQGNLGNSSGSHLHCGVEWGNTTIDSLGSDSNFSSQNIYYAMQFFGY